MQRNQNVAVWDNFTKVEKYFLKIYFINTAAIDLSAKNISIVNLFTEQVVGGMYV